MNLTAQNNRVLLKKYLEDQPHALQKGGDYARFRRIAIEVGCEDEDVPSIRTFNRMLNEARQVSHDPTARLSTRVNRTATSNAAISMTEKELLTALLAGTAHYEEVEFWIVHHGKTLRINNRVLSDDDGRVYPPADTSAATKEIKGFIAGYLYARRNG